VQPGLLEDALQGMQNRINQLLDQQGLDISAQPQRIHIRKDAGRPVPGELFENVLQALFKRQKLAVEYHGRRRDAVSERVISPQRLTSYRDRWYLDAWCHQVEGLRSFAIERLRTVSVLDEPADAFSAEQLEADLGRAYGIFSGPARYTCKLRFDAEAARWAAEEQWHPEQRGRWLKDGRYELAFEYGQDRELIMDILRYGADVEVLSPASLRARVAEAHQQAAQHYDNCHGNDT